MLPYRLDSPDLGAADLCLWPVDPGRHQMQELQLPAGDTVAGVVTTGAGQLLKEPLDCSHGDRTLCNLHISPTTEGPPSNMRYRPPAGGDLRRRGSNKYNFHRCLSIPPDWHDLARDSHRARTLFSFKCFWIGFSTAHSDTELSFQTLLPLSPPPLYPGIPPTSSF